MERLWYTAAILLVRQILELSPVNHYKTLEVLKTDPFRPWLNELVSALRDLKSGRQLFEDPTSAQLAELKAQINKALRRYWPGTQREFVAPDVLSRVVEQLRNFRLDPNHVRTNATPYIVTTIRNTIFALKKKESRNPTTLSQLGNEEDRFEHVVDQVVRGGDFVTSEDPIELQEKRLREQGMQLLAALAETQPVLADWVNTIFVENPEQYEKRGFEGRALLSQYYHALGKDLQLTMEALYAIVGESLNRLASSDREVLTRVIIFGQSYKHIAEQCSHLPGCHSFDSLKMKIFRARNKFAKVLIRVAEETRSERLPLFEDYSRN